MEIKKYNSNFFQSFVDLIDHCFSIQNTDKSKLILWKFFLNPNHFENIIICAYDKNIIVWQYSNIATHFLYKQQSLLWYVCQDMCVLTDFRGQWIVSKMSRFLYSNSNQTTFSVWFSNSQWVKIDIYSQWYGYKILKQFYSYTFLNFWYQKDCYEYKKIIHKNELQNINFQKMNYFDEFIKIHGDREYIQWRYFEKPNSQYHFFSLYDNNTMIGYVICTFKKWYCNIYDINFIKNIDTKKMISTWKNIWFHHNTFFLRILVVKNNFWKKFFDWFFKIQKKQNIYFTLKKHNNFEKIDIFDIEKWMIKTWDIL